MRWRPSPSRCRPCTGRRGSKTEEDLVHRHPEAGELGVLGGHLARHEAQFTAGRDDDDLAARGKDQPDDLRAVLEVPAGLLAQRALLLGLLLPLDLDREQGSYAGEALQWPTLLRPPDG